MRNGMKLWLNLFVICCGLTLFSGCRYITDLFSSPDDGSGFDTQAVYVEDGEPRIVAGLTLRISVSASGASAVQEGQKEVDTNGEILMPLIGKVKCEGMTLLDLQEKLASLYKAYFIEPEVSCSFAYVANSNMKSPWGTVLVMGSVGHPGPVNMPSTRDLTVVRALMLASNATALADKSRIRVTRRQKDGSLKKFIVDIEKIGKEGRSEMDILLKPGDVIWVPESWY